MAITGKLEEAGKQPVLFANVGLYSSLDSTLTGGAVSDEKGNFTIAAVPGKYFLIISYLDLNEKIVPNIIVQNHALSLGVISLKADAEQLKEVVVTAMAKFTEKVPDGATRDRFTTAPIQVLFMSRTIAA
ncbi:carboxypeptidase-like regulatory domain-containing protein [Dyadobacter alkalitolerans]|uniref:carboxypeptidase-like regulatory domain-containing protein n=1 Tax=Dyadobacter alkalitolerans TaxID=492736 RepID=UPI00040432DB|nr:carboxypeptidase-like regulatory domain-containing protein [Dyadobacter alkalitolerans]